MSAAQAQGGAQALPTLLSVIPSLPRPVLARLTARMIERLDELDGDPDLEDDDEDSCVTDRPHDEHEEGDREDDTTRTAPRLVYSIDQREVLSRHAAAPPRFHHDT